MGSVTGAWETPSAERGGRRIALAFILSLLCHGLLLGALRGSRVQARPVPPLVVTMLGAGDDGGGAAAPGPDEAPRAPAAAAVAAPVAPPPPPVVGPRPAVAKAPSVVPRPPRARERPTRETAVASASPGAAPAAEAPASPTGDAHGDAGHAAGAAVAGLGADSGAGAGSGRPGIGGGTGGGDGLRAFCASCPAPAYPGRARRQGWQGTVDVALAIASDGSVREARVERSSGFPSLDDVAVDVARRSRFTVPEGGEGLRGQLRYRFVLDATAASR